MAITPKTETKPEVITDQKIVTKTPAPDKATSLKKLLDASQKEIAAALPKHLTPERMARIALTEVRKNPELLECDPASFIGSVIQAAQLGLEPGNALGHCYLIPFWNSRKRIKEVQFLIGYRGMIDLADRSGKVGKVIARAVYDCDQFDYEFGLNERLVHKPGVRTKESRLTHVYVIVSLLNGEKQFDVMTRDEVEAVRARSPAGAQGPWTTDHEAMSKKSVVRRLFKYTPVSVEMQRAIGLDEAAERGEQNNADIIETTGRSVGPSKGMQLAAAIGEAPEAPTDESVSFDEFDKSQAR